MKKRDDDDKSGKKSNDAGGGGEGGGERKAQGGTRREEASGSKSSDACSGPEEYRDYGELFLLYTTPQIRTKQSILVKRAMANRSGIQIDQYVIPLIGMGTFGDVGIVMRRKDKKLAAIKICDRVNLDFAKQEVDIQRSLLDNGGDKFITKIYDAFTTKNKLAITMELGTCGSLQDFIQSRDGSGSYLSEAESREVLQQTFMALEHVHGAEVVHFDIKPANILVCYESPLVIKLTDFGSSVYIADITVPILGGTAMYAAPELSTEDGTPNENVDVKYVQAVDVFGVGLVAVDCVLGTIPKEEQMEHLAFRESRKTAVVVKYPAMGSFFSAVCSEDPTARPNASAVLCLPWLLQNVDQNPSTPEVEELREEIATLRLRVASEEEESARLRRRLSLRKRDKS